VRTAGLVIPSSRSSRFLSLSLSSSLLSTSQLTPRPTMSGKLYPRAALLAANPLRAPLARTRTLLQRYVHGSARIHRETTAIDKAPSPLSASRPFSSLTYLAPRRPCLTAQIPKLETPSTSPQSIAPLAALSPMCNAIQVRGGHRRATLDPSHRVRKRRHGFLARNRSKTGRRILMRRRLKHRKSLTH
jgi:large subunit ribosomal protein L34